MKVLVLDTVHGGKILAETYLKKKNEVTVVDVYKVTPKEVLANLRHRGAKVADAAPAEHFDVVTMPCHCPDRFLGECTYDRRIFFSDSVGELIDDRRFRIEITGVKGKTSTCYLLAHLLCAAGKKVFLHTSRGLGPYIDGKHIITDMQSIAPPTLLALPKGEYDVLVCELSLGGSGKANLAGITNLLEDYGIAKNTRTAEFGKMAVLTDRGVNIVPEGEVGIWSNYGKNLRPYGNRVEIIGEPEFGKPLRLAVEYRGRQEVCLSGDYLALQYLDAISMALEFCDEMDVPVDAVLQGLSTFKGVPGRGEISEENGVRCLRDRNPGISHMSVERTLSCLKRMNALEDAVLVIDPVSKKVCDKMDKDLIAEVASRYGVPMLVTDGMGNEPEIPSDRKTIIRMIKEGYQ
ncbi:MAG: coenzyme F430 synthase [archaeon]|nr:coenzyme F430 synthase [archaeon]